MGEAADRVVKEIEQTRARIERDLAELEARLPGRVRSTKTAVGAVLGASTVAGIGSWRLYEDDGATAVLFEWRVHTTRWWMNALAPVARPVFRWNHDRLMRAGGRGLARRLGVELLSGA